jgi:hypothetical protein
MGGGLILNNTSDESQQTFLKKILDVQTRILMHLQTCKMEVTVVDFYFWPKNRYFAQSKE